MAHIPSLEESLTQIYKCLGIKEKSLSDKKVERFQSFNTSLDVFGKTLEEITAAILNALDIDQRHQDDARLNIHEWAQFNKALELSVWTANASLQQVVWYLLAYVHVPHLARRIAFWQLATVESDSAAIDAGMPGGKFWYLPALNVGEDRLVMPMTAVIDWLLDLLNLSSIYGMKGAVGHRSLRDQNESVIRTLNHWRSGKHLPKSAAKIDELFPDDVSLQFDGALCLSPAMAIDEKISFTLNFLAKKGLGTAERMHEQIPMSETRIGAVLAHMASTDEKNIFIDQMSTRYAAPAISTIRQRLKVARLSQDGYARLLQLLCPAVDQVSTDAEQNKVLQLVALFQTIYNLTIDAWDKRNTEFAQDAYFESQLAVWDKADLLLSIVPSMPADKRADNVAKRLTRLFLEIDGNGLLENLVPYGKEINDRVSEVIMRRLSMLKLHGEEDVRLENLKSRICIASPWRALQAETSFWVVGQLAGQVGLNSKLQGLVLSRLRELARTDGQKTSVTLLEVCFILNAHPKSRPANAIALVEGLLADAERSAGYEQWKGPLLNAKAKHQLFQNDVESAVNHMKQALLACADRNFGQTRGLIARDLLALLVSSNKLNYKNDQKYYREFIYYANVPAPISYDGFLKACERYFQQSLYRPYDG